MWRRSEVGGQKTEDRGQGRTGVGSQGKDGRLRDENKCWD